MKKNTHTKKHKTQCVFDITMRKQTQKRKKDMSPPTADFELVRTDF